MADDLHIAREVLLGALFGPRPPFEVGAVMSRMLDGAELIDVRPGDVLCREGDPTDHVFAMAEGRLRLSRQGLADFVYRGRWAVGTVDAILRRPRRRTIVVEAGTRILRTPARAYGELIEESVDLAAVTLLGLGMAIDDHEVRLGATSHARPPMEAGTAPASLVGRLALLEQVPFLAGATLQAIVDIAAGTTIEELAPGARPALLGQRDPRVFVVAAGRIEVARGPETRSFGPGEVVGGMAWHRASEGRLDARAIEPSSVLAFAVDDWLDRMEEHPSLATAGVGALSAERERLQEELAARLGELVLD